MAVLNGMLRKMKGSAGDLTFKVVNGQTIVSEKVTNVKNLRSAAQQKHRLKWGNIIRMYKGIAPLLNCAFENKAPGVSDYNMFVRLNMKLCAVYLPKHYVANGACIVAPYQITQGTLPSIVVTGEGANRTTDISLGSLTVGAATTVAELSNAVVQHNDSFNYGDQISFFTILQHVNAATQMPYCVFQASSIVLDKQDASPVWAVAHKAGFQSKGGFLAHGENEGDGAFCWVHTRKSLGKTLVSTQLLLNNNALLDEYSSDKAYVNAVGTYGGENNVFLTPDTAKSNKVDTTTPSSAKYSIAAVASPVNGGSISGTGEFASGASVTLKATAASGYKFTRWSDGNTSASRTFNVTKAESFTALFETVGSGGSDPLG